MDDATLKMQVKAANYAVTELVHQSVCLQLIRASIARIKAICFFKFDIMKLQQQKS